MTATDARAFPPHPRLDRYFPSAAAEEARTRLASCVERGEGPALLIGAAGAGKTMLLEVLTETFRNQFAVAPLAGGQLCTRRALLQSLLYALDLPYRDREEGELRLAISGYLTDTQSCPSGVLLLVDEAHALPPRLLEELRVLGNLARDGEPVVRIVLAGTTALEERLAAPELETLNQRIAARCYLSPMTYEEQTQYVRAHIAATGANPDELLSPDVPAAIFEATDGIPRLVNQLCDRAIVLAVAAGSTVIDRSAIQNAWSDLHQLPAPWHNDEPEATISSGVEIVDAIPTVDVIPTIGPPVANDAFAAEAVTAPLSTPEQLSSEGINADPVEHAGSPAPVWNADAALSQTAGAELDTADAASEQATPTLPAPGSPPRAVDPFADDFEEEETLLDPYADGGSLFPAGTPIVSNQEDTAFSTQIATFVSDNDERQFDASEVVPSEVAILGLDAERGASQNPEADEQHDCDHAPLLTTTPPVEVSIAEASAAEASAAGASTAEVAPVADSPAVAINPQALQSSEEHDPTGLTFSVTSVETSNDAASVPVATPDFEQGDRFAQADREGNDELALLVIEDDPVDAPVDEASPSVHRQEYRQLFASLRGAEVSV